MERLTKVQWAMALVDVTAKRSTCLHRQIGCVLLNAKGHVLATGYNGAASGLPHCSDLGFCAKEDVGFTSGQGHDHCVAIHAEQNALMQCRFIDEIDTAYISCSPCMTCAKLFLNTGVKAIFYHKQYPDTKALDMLINRGIQCSQVSI